MALQKCNESGCIWSHPPRNEKLSVGSSEDAVLCGGAWLKLLSPKDGSAVKPAILPCWELTGLGERFVVQLRGFFSSVSLTAYRKTCAARVAQEVGGLLKGLGVAFPLWLFGMGLVMWCFFFLRCSSPALTLAQWWLQMPNTIGTAFPCWCFLSAIL